MSKEQIIKSYRQKNLNKGLSEQEYLSMLYELIIIINLKWHTCILLLPVVSYNETDLEDISTS